jgi:hypothetical protein
MYQRLFISVAAAVALSLALFVQATSAKPIPVVQTPYLSEGLNVGVQPQQPDSLNSTTTQVASSGSEFDWSDAGIGAGVVFGTILLGAGLVLTVRRRDFPIPQ